MSRHQPGAVIGLVWDGDPEAVYTYGHVTPDAFRASVAAYYDMDDLSFGGFPILDGEPAHRWGRYCFNGSDEWGDARRVLRTFDKPSRGAFRVTVADVRWEHRLRCKGHAGDRPCWIRADHKGEHMDFDAWKKRKDAGVKP